MRTMKTLDKLTVFLCLSVFQVNSLNADINDPKNYLPHWEPLCEKGHEYLFSEESTGWDSAREMCQLLGGYLARIENRHENNCILGYTMTNGLHDYWWHSGKI